MTIPGKGGRPRKWRSDADRVRAFRARQRGEEEPPVLAVALDEGDELAAAWEQVRQLGERLDEQRTVERSLRKELSAALRELEQLQHRFGWLSEDEALRGSLEEVGRDRGDELDGRAAANERNTAQRHRVELRLRDADADASDGRTDPIAPNRAQRRRASKDARRRS